MFDVALFLEALTTPAMLRGAFIALLLSVVVFAASFVLCLPIAVVLDDRRPALRWTAKSYTWLFRAAPLLVVLLLVWNGLPQLVPGLIDANWYTPFLAAFLAMTLVTVAYMAEIMRGALRSVGPGQKEAATALGLRPLQTFMLIQLPQALRVAAPILMNELISLVKLTSLAYTVSVREIMAVVNNAIAASFRFVEWYSAALVYYIAIVSLLMIAQNLIVARRGSSMKGGTTHAMG